MSAQHISLSPAEHFRIYGTLPERQIEALLDKTAVLDSVTLSDIKSEIKEARGQFPEEDFLQDILNDLANLRKHVRGDNRDYLDTIIETVEERVGEINGSTEYGREKLDSITETVNRLLEAA